jgi:hypothetical protein
MKHKVPHDLDTAHARRVTDHALQAYSDRFSEYNPQVSWTNDKEAVVSFKAKGVTLKGTFEILEDAISMDMEVPFILKMFKKKAIDVIEREIKEWIQRAKNGELDAEVEAENG